MLGDSYWMTAQWGARVETPAALANRFIKTVDAFRPLHPILDNWDWGNFPELKETLGKRGTYAFAEIRKNLIPAVERNLRAGDEGVPHPFYGYYLAIMTGGTPMDPSIGFSTSASTGARGGYSFTPFMNSATVKLRSDPDPSLVTFDLWRSIFLVVNETWEATWAEALPNDLRAYWTGIPVRCAWMSYISPRFAPLMTPPASAIVERRPNGGLFLAATREVFKTANPEHMAVAREIETALQPLNRLPNPIDAPYR